MNDNSGKEIASMSYAELPSSLRISFLVPQFTSSVNQGEFAEALKLLRDIGANLDQYIATAKGDFSELDEAYSKMETYLRHRMVGAKSYLRVFLKELSNSGIAIR